MKFDSFENDFRYADHTKDQKTDVSSMTVGIQQAGALVGCFAVWPLTNRMGRRFAIIVCSLIFCIGVVLEVINTHSLPAFYVGRVICGLGVGGSSVVIPIYMSEMAPKDIRGRLGSCYQWMFTIGIFCSYWVDYAVDLAPQMANKPIQWQIPIGLQMVPGGLMGLGMLTLKESARWLIYRGEHERAWESLKWVRASDSDDIREEFAEMKQGVEDDRRLAADFHPKELLEWPNLHRLILAFAVFCAQQSTGATALAYFGPQFFSILVGDDNSKTLLLTAIFGAVKVVACGIFVVFVAERFGRRSLFMWGAFFMAACMITTAAVVKEVPPPGDGSVTAAGVATVALIYLNIIGYNCSWGPLPWPYVSEIFSPRIREPGVAVGVGAQWLFNFVYSFSTPYMMNSMAWGTFLLYGAFDLGIVAFVFFFIKETADKTLEEVNAMFHTVGNDPADAKSSTSIHIERNHQNSKQ